MGKLFVLVVVLVVVSGATQVKTVIPTAILGKNKITLTKGK